MIVYILLHLLLVKVYLEYSLRIRACVYIHDDIVRAQSQALLHHGHHGAVVLGEM